MLEVLRALSKQEERLPHNIIFLFNGAEENILQVNSFGPLSVLLLLPSLVVIQGDGTCQMLLLQPLLGG